MDERLRFVARLLDGEKMTVVCREFGISRKTGYKFLRRYPDLGLRGLTDRSRRPYRQANRLPFQVEKRIVQLKQDHPSWGAPKIREKLRRRGRTRYHAEGTPLSRPASPNELWCADYKGEFMLADRRYCYPLTVTDYASRYLLGCEAFSTNKEVFAFSVFERLFKDYGLPQAIRTDNGVPFSCNNAIFGLSKLSVWWLRLGIAIERIKPGHPQRNGRHERMHLTLKKEATKPAARNLLLQQARFDGFIHCFNHERPHQALAMRCPAECYSPSPRPYRGLEPLEYPLHDRTVTVTHCGRICLGRRKINLSKVFAGRNIGIKEVSDKIWLVTFMQYDLGYFDHETGRVESAENPFAARVLPMPPA
jgi:putative transposase